VKSQGIAVKSIKRIILLLAAFSLNAIAGPEQIKKEFEKKYPEIKVDRVTKTMELFEICRRRDYLHRRGGQLCCWAARSTRRTATM
jgi:hypothetical protein